MGTMSDYGRFFREFRRDFHHTGAVLPSGLFLARELARPLMGPRPPFSVLEVGPGTGAVTRCLARHLRPDDRLDAVEINANFAALLSKSLADDPAFSACRDRIRVLNAPLQDVPGEAVYDLIVSGLPLNNFSVAEVRSVFVAFRRLLKPSGTLCYFEYAFVRRLKAPFAGRSERYRLARLGGVLKRYIDKHQTECRRVWLNAPPALVRRLRFGP
jgi:phosphatidylethanolamine/phosphatidyl-N-methylethanolamine N-methyltransferase